MTPRTFFRPLAAALAATMLGTGCAPDRAVSPAANVLTPSAAVGATFTTLATQPGTTVPVVQRLTPLASDISVTQTIGPLGGIVSIPEAGLIVYFTPGAVPHPIQITATANAGSLVSYSFEPHGTQFAGPVYVAQNLLQTNVSTDVTLASSIAGGYTPNGLSDINDTTGTASVSELHSAVTQTQRVKHGKVILTGAIYTIQHFSGYILTGGRR